MKIEIKGAIVPDGEGWIYDYFEIPCCCPKKVNRALAQAAGKEVDIYINSGGGNIFAGSEIYEAIRAYPGKKKIHVVGTAASAASVVACAGPSEIAPTAMVMIHNASSPGAAGDYHAKDKESEVLQKANQAIAAAYTEKNGMSQEEALRLMDRETWLSAKEAVELGLIDAISQPAGQEIGLTAAAGGLLPQEVIETIRRTHKPPNAQRAQAQLELLKLKGAVNL